ncbi:hypothetical protein BC835DRAFT_108338 [Cytidiella melzeri]|nr:hypothetical protein BC835DRAFT_108338 [Cytidiella melzeri]
MPFALLYYCCSISVWLWCLTAYSSSKRRLYGRTIASISVRPESLRNDCARSHKALVFDSIKLTESSACASEFYARHSAERTKTPPDPQVTGAA